MAVLAGFLTLPFIASSVLGMMDFEWRNAIYASEYQCFPKEWSQGDWFRIFVAFGFMLVHCRVFPATQLAVHLELFVLTVTAIGTAGAFAVTWLPYALPF